MTGIIAQNVGRPSGLIKAASGGGGVWTLIKTLTASADATLSFVDGASDVVLDSTYPIYVFKFINIHPATDENVFSFNLSIDAGSNYNVTKTTTLFRAYHGEDGSGGALAYKSDVDLAQGTGFQVLGEAFNDNDQSISGELWLFNPSSTTFVKHFMSNFTFIAYGDNSQNFMAAGYGNTTSAVDAIQFKMNDGNMDDGKIKLYGLKDSA